MVTWTTDAVKPDERFSFWREAVCQTILNVSTEARPQRFWARLSGRSVGGFRFAAFDSSGHEIVRSRQLLSSAPADNYLISLQRRGRCHIGQDDADLSLDPGEIAVVDGQRPFHVVFPQPVSRVLAVVPKAALDSIAPSLRQTPLLKISNRSPFAPLIRSHLLELANVTNELSEIEVNVLSSNLFDLMALSIARDTPAHMVRPELQLAAILVFCRQQLANPELSAQMVAARFNISIRTLQLWFKKTGQTFGKWMLDNRLEASRIALRDPNRRALSISEIAYRSGFNDLSHFNKAFRARFHQTPGEWRNGGPRSVTFGLHDYR
jgi:AraC family transcriptional regulator, positive regulator of tynA and feaB